MLPYADAILDLFRTILSINNENCDVVETPPASDICTSTLHIIAPGGVCRLAERLEQIRVYKRTVAGHKDRLFEACRQRSGTGFHATHRAHRVPVFGSPPADGPRLPIVEG